ncbi:MAG: response regulator [Deltaproteobacteria bacterium]|nr:response regulator [Deltaproteobacteria bacterium]
MAVESLVILGTNGVVSDATDEACRRAGIPKADLVGHLFVDLLAGHHRPRFVSELEALVGAREDHGRLNCAVVGQDGIGRLLTLNLALGDDGAVQMEIAEPQRANEPPMFQPSSLVYPGRLLPAALRILAVCQRASNRADILRGGLEVMREITGASSGAVVGWAEPPGRGEIAAVSGRFDESRMKGVFRVAVIARLARGDVVIKEADMDGASPDASLVLVPLLSTPAPEGVVVLGVDGYSVLSPEEQLGLKILGEVMGLGIKSLAFAARKSSSDASHAGDPGDIEAAVALGRLSAGLAHEINNAATVLGGSLDQLAARRGRYGSAALAESLTADSANALETIRDLTDALQAFAPEETFGDEEVDLQRVLEMVVRSVRFYAKPAISVELVHPRDAVPLVRCRSHYLIRSLFLILVQLVEAATRAGRELAVRMSTRTARDDVHLSIAVAAGPVSLPAVFLAQLVSGGALERHVSHAGAKLDHAVDGAGNLTMELSFPALRGPRRSVPPPPSHPTSGRRGTILVVDDDLAVIRSLRRVLSKRHDVLAASSAEEALEILGANQAIDVVLCNVFLPEMGGPDLYREMKRQQHPAAERLVFVTGGAVDGEISRFLSATSRPVLEKPLDIPLLKSLIAALIQ